MASPADLNPGLTQARPDSFAEAPSMKGFWNQRRVTTAKIVGTVAVISVLAACLFFIPGAPLAMVGAIISGTVAPAFGIHGICAIVALMSLPVISALFGCLVSHYLHPIAIYPPQQLKDKYEKSVLFSLLVQLNERKMMGPGLMEFLKTYLKDEMHVVTDFTRPSNTSEDLKNRILKALTEELKNKILELKPKLEELKNKILELKPKPEELKNKISEMIIRSLEERVSKLITLICYLEELKAITEEKYGSLKKTIDDLEKEIPILKTLICDPQNLEARTEDEKYESLKKTIDDLENKILKLKTNKIAIPVVLKGGILGRDHIVYFYINTNEISFDFCDSQGRTVEQHPETIIGTDHKTLTDMQKELTNFLHLYANENTIFNGLQQNQVQMQTDYKNCGIFVAWRILNEYLLNNKITDPLLKELPKDTLTSEQANGIMRKILIDLICKFIDSHPNNEPLDDCEFPEDDHPSLLRNFHQAPPV